MADGEWGRLLYNKPHRLVTGEDSQNLRTMKEWLTMAETQRLLDYTSRNAVYNYCRTYKVRVTKPRGRIYFNHADLLKVQSSNAVRMGY